MDRFAIFVDKVTRRSHPPQVRSACFHLLEYILVRSLSRACSTNEPSLALRSVICLSSLHLALSTFRFLRQSFVSSLHNLHGNKRGINSRLISAL